MRFFIIVIVLFIYSQNVSSQQWETDFKTAKELAVNNHLPIILVFQGSDWCVPCIKLTREVWDTQTFKMYAKDHYVLLMADFPRRKKNTLPKALQEQNISLAEQYNKQGIFPLVVILDSEGVVLGKTGYRKLTTQSYIDHINSFLN